jgi:hypothetical protein
MRAQFNPTDGAVQKDAQHPIAIDTLELFS